MTAEEFYFDDHYKVVFYSSDGSYEKQVFRFAEAYAKHENEALQKKADSLAAKVEELKDLLDSADPNHEWTDTQTIIDWYVRKGKALKE